jgi:signal transduction histidine kinase
MFKKLRNKIIITNIVFTTLVLIVAFSGIFFFSANGMRHRPMPEPRVNVTRNQEVQDEMREILNQEIERDRSDQLKRLAISLISIGLSIEVLIFLASYVYAEKSIQPVKDAYNKQREFIANASHELKTPIAAVQANFEALGTTEQPWTDNVENELNRASKLVSDLLLLARTDGRVTGATKKPTNVSKILNSRLDVVRSRLGEKTLETEISEKVTVNVNSADFTQLADILIDNAIKYSSKKITVKLSEKSFSIENDGKTIPAEKLEKVFERFYQTDKTAEGSGLGLSIAKALADQNGWKITVTSENKITKFSVKF